MHSLNRPRLQASLRPDAAIASRPAPATAQHATGAQCSSGAYSGSFCRPPATAAIRAKVASASAENTSPITLPSAPVSPIASAADTALISMQPQAAPATNCAAISMLRLPASSAASTASAPNRPAAPITISPPRCLTTTLAGNIAMLKPIQNTGSSHGNWSAVGETQEERRTVEAEMQLIAERQDDHRCDEDHRHRAQRLWRDDRLA